MPLRLLSNPNSLFYPYKLQAYQKTADKSRRSFLMVGV